LNTSLIFNGTGKAAQITGNMQSFAGVTEYLYLETVHGIVRRRRAGCNKQIPYFHHSNMIRFEPER
jgi:hypothetical protein